MINNEINQTATDMHNLASDTEQMGTGIGQSSPNIDLDATTGPDKPLSFKPTYETTPKEPERTHGDIMSDIQKYESEIDTLNEIQELFRKGDLMKAQKLAEKLSWDAINYFNEESIKEQLKPNFKIADLANLFDPRKSELLNNIKGLKEHESFDNRTDEQKREDKLLADQREREDTTAQRGTEDMLKAGLHPASANYGGSIGGSSGGGGGSGGSESEKEKERRRRRKKLLEERKRAREREKRQNVISLLSRMGSAATYGGMRAALYRPKNMNTPTSTSYQNNNKIIQNNKVKGNEPDWLNEYLDEIKEMKPANENNNSYKPKKTNRKKTDKELLQEMWEKELEERRK